MAFAEASIIHHVAVVMAALWVLASMGWAHPFVFFVSFLYLYKVNKRYSLRLRRRMQFEERKHANQRKLLLNTESVRWLNRIVESVWPICMEQIASQKFLLPIIPWFLDKYKPWTAKKAAVRHLYLGRSPPTFTEVRVIHEPEGDDHMILELGMNFLSAEDMIAVLGVQLRKRLGFGIRAKMHVTGMHVEGKISVGLKFIHNWPFIARVRVCFVEPPYFQMTIKPIFHHGVDVSDIPGIAGWLDKVLTVAFEQTLVEPNMLVVDVEKFASKTTERWFTMDEKYPIAFAKVEILEAVDMKPSDLSGIPDPYVKGKLGPYRFTTKTQKKTLSPIWREEFKIPITSWEAPNVLSIQVCDKARIFDDTIGDCCININDLRDGQRHDEWLVLKHIKTGRLHLAITVLGENKKDANRGNVSDDDEDKELSETAQSCTTGVSLEEIGKRGDEDKELSETAQSCTTGVSLEEIGKRGHDKPIIIEENLATIKSHGYQSEIYLYSDDSDCSESSGSVSNNDKDMDGNSRGNSHGKIRRGLHNIKSKFQKKKAEEKQRTSVNQMVDDSSESGDAENTGKGHIRDKAKNILKKIGDSVDHLKDTVSRKGHGNTKEDQVDIVEANGLVSTL